MVIGFFAGVEGSDGGDDVHSTDGWNHLVEFAFLGVQRALVSHRGDAVDSLAVEHADVVTSSYSAIGASAVTSVALIPNRKYNQIRQFFNSIF